MGKGSFISILISNTPLFLRSKTGRRVVSFPHATQSVVFICQMLLKAFFLGQTILILWAISDSLIQILFYAPIFKLNLPGCCLLFLTTHHCLQAWQFLLSSPWIIAARFSLPFLSFSVTEAHKACEIFPIPPAPTPSQPLTNFFCLCTSLKNRWFLF